MNRVVEKLSEHIERKLSEFPNVDKINIILELRETLDKLEREAMIEEYELELDYFE